MASTEMEDYFAEASDRLLNGESLERIIVDYPAAVRQELQALLVVVELADQVATIKPPQRLPVNRIAARVEFSQRVAAKRAEIEAAQTPLPPAVRPAASALRTQRGGLAEVWRKLAAAWSSLGASAPVMRLAPLTLLLIALYLSTFTVVATAQAALPGDLAYPVKSWMREQRVATAPTAQQPAERWRADQEQAKDVAARAEQLQSEPDAAPLTAVSILQFRGFEGDQLLLGDLKVIPWYRPEGGAEDEWLPITIDGELQPGAVVMLRYQIVPGASDAVQGIALSVMQAPPLPTPAPTATPAEARHCQRIQAPNWVAYVVKSGETLSSIAARSQTSVAELRRVNCLTDGVLRAGTTIFVPATILGALPPAPPPAVATAIATQPPLPTATLPAPTETLPAPTVTPSPPTSAPTLTPAGTETQGGDAEATPTAQPDDGTATPAPTVSATVETTPATTATPTTPEASETAAPTAPAGTATEPPATATGVATSAAPTPTAPAPTEPPATATSIATDSTLPPTASAPTTQPTSAAPTATSIATSVAPAAQHTVAPTPTSPSPTVAPPTATQPPPTPVPPTPVPPTPIPPTPMDAPAGDANPAETP